MYILLFLSHLIWSLLVLFSLVSFILISSLLLLFSFFSSRLFSPTFRFFSIHSSHPKPLHFPRRLLYHNSIRLFFPLFISITRFSKSSLFTSVLLSISASATDYRQRHLRTPSQIHKDKSNESPAFLPVNRSSNSAIDRGPAGAV